MTSHLRTLAGPAYLAACLLLGGSTQGVGFVLTLQLVAIALLAWALLARRQGPRDPYLLAIILAGLAMIALQLVPLPPGVWAALPGREPIAQGFVLLGQPLPWMPISMVPEDTIVAALALLPPLAMLALVTRLGAYRAPWLAIVLLLATGLAVALGFSQVTSGGPYLYPFVALGNATGTFANSNHLAALLLTAIPFAAALAVNWWRGSKRAEDKGAAALVGAGLVAMLAIGIALNGSLAILLLGGPVLLGSLLLLVPAGRARLGRMTAAVMILLAVSALAVAMLKGVSLGESNRTSVDDRVRIWSTGTAMLGDHMLTGSGLGTFATVYRTHEDPARVEREYVNHAHNDYLEIATDLGFAGIALILAFFLWWTVRTLAIWRSPDADIFARAATIASGALLLHSAVDFPLRTAALAAVFAMAIGLMVARRSRQPQPDPRAPKARHLSLDQL